MSRLMQAFYAMKLPCSEKRQKNTLYSGNNTRWQCRQIILLNRSISNLSPRPVWPPYRTQSLHLLKATVILPTITQVRCKIRTDFPNAADKCSGDITVDHWIAKFTENQILPEYCNACMSGPALSLPTQGINFSQTQQFITQFCVMNCCVWLKFIPCMN